MIRLQVLAPFRHVFRNKDIWLTAHEYYYLDPVKDKEELKYFLSDSFSYKNCVYFDKQKLDKALLKEASEESGFSPFGYNPAQEEKAELEKTFESEHNAFTKPLLEAEPNPFAEQEEGYKFKPRRELIEDSNLEEEVQLPQILNTNKLPQLEEAIPQVYIKEDDKETRTMLLHNLHWRKLKDIAEGYGINYTDKESVVKEILKLEYK